MNLEAILNQERICTDTLRPLEGWEENGILQLEIPGAEAYAIWNRLVARTPAAGYYPVVSTMQNLDYLTENALDESIAAARDEVLEYARKQTFAGWLEQQRDPAFHVAKWLRMAEHMETLPGGEAMAKVNRDMAENWRKRPRWQFDPASCPWPDEPVYVHPPAELFGLHNGLDDVTAENAAILVVPTADSCEVPAHLLFGGFNSCPQPEVHVAMLRTMQERYGARLLVVDSGTIEIVVSRRPANRDEALRLAADFITYAECFLGADEGNQTEGAIAAYLMASDCWGFWWD